MAACKDGARSPKWRQHTKASRKRHCAIAVVTAEEFVPAIAGERHFHIATCLAREVMGRQRGAVRKGYTEHARQLRKILDGTGCYMKLMVFGAKMLSNGARHRRFVVARIIEADREGLYASVFSCACCDDA